MLLRSARSTSERGGVAHDAAHDLPVLVVRRTTGWRFLDLREVWAYRELIYFLVWRDVKVRYKQTAIGVAWAVLQPLAMMLVFSVFFSRLAAGSSAGVPYPLFSYAALLPWQLFSRIIMLSANSLVSDQRLITRVYFPRIIVPLATTLAALLDFAISAVPLAALMLIYRIAPAPAVAWLPVFVVLLLVTALGVGFWLSALNVEYRDVTFVMPFLNQLWLFVTPVAYSSSLVPVRWRVLYGLNPMTGVVDGFRWALLGLGDGPTPVLMASTGVAAALFVSGIVWFRLRERIFIDVIGSGSG